jgi:hypothetical protein
MALDLSKVSEGHMSPEMARRLTKGGWTLFAKMKKGDWKTYFLDGEDGLISEEAVAREMYDLLLREPRCEAASLVRLSPEKSFDRRPKEWTPRRESDKR